MTAQERKERIIDIIDRIEDLKKDIRAREDNIQIMIDKVYELNDMFYNNFSEVDGFDAEELKVNIITAFIEDTEFEGVKESIEEFKSDIEEYMDEVSETRREKLEEKYTDLENVIDLFDISTCETIESVIDILVDAEDYLKGMK